jgi:hypothetical protein
VAVAVADALEAKEEFDKAMAVAVADAVKAKEDELKNKSYFEGQRCISCISL